MHEAVKEFKKRLMDCYPDRLVRFIVFGSYARGDHREDSDIDLLVTLTGPVDWNPEREIFTFGLIFYFLN
jgi:predicted nucleotidyltransferase